MTKPKQKPKVDWKISITAIVCLTLMELVAMFYGINGTMRTMIFTLIALIVGIQMPQFKR